MSKTTTNLYGLKNCDSCRKALKSISAAGIDATLIDVRDQRLGKAMLTIWCRKFGHEKLLNRRSTTWRSLSDEEKSLDSNKAAVELLIQHPTLMKRPVIIQGDTLLLGFDNDTISQLKS